MGGPRSRRPFRRCLTSPGPPLARWVGRIPIADIGRRRESKRDGIFSRARKITPSARPCGQRGGILRAVEGRGSWNRSGARCAILPEPRTQLADQTAGRTAMAGPHTHDLPPSRTYGLLAASRIATRAPRRGGRSGPWRTLKVAIYYASKLRQTERHNEASTPA